MPSWRSRSPAPSGDGSVVGSWPEGDVVFDGQVGEQRGVLEDQADAPPLGRKAT